jgi:hypothetical protein
MFDFTRSIGYPLSESLAKGGFTGSLNNHILNEVHTSCDGKAYVTNS